MTNRAASRRLLSLQILGIPCIVAMGLPLHFVFDWTDGWLPVAIFAPVNESVWEHFKLVFWPGVVWAAIESAFWPHGRLGFWAAKGIALLAAPAVIAGLFYAYTVALGKNLLVLDISIFVIAVISMQVVSIYLLGRERRIAKLPQFGIGFLALQAISYASFAFYPPPLGLFEDGRTGTRGIEAPVLDHVPYGPDTPARDAAFPSGSGRR